MKTLRQTVCAVALALVALSASATAQERRHKAPSPELKAAFTQLRTSMKTWRTENVLPRLREWKAQYDASLSPADLATLNSLRARAAALRREKYEMMEQMHEAWKSGKTEEAARLREGLREKWEKHKAIVAELRPIAERSRAKLEEIGGAAQQQAGTWHDQTREIAQKWFDQNRELLAGNPFPPHAGKMARSFWPGLKGEKGKRHAAIRFMLWDGGDIEEMAPQGMERTSPNDATLD